MRYSKRQSEAGKAPFVRSRGDRYANAPVESMTGLAAPDFCNDPDDAPKPTAEFFKCADLYGGTKFSARGWPKSVTLKEPVRRRLDANMFEILRARGKGRPIRR